LTSGRFFGINQAGLPPTFDGNMNRVLNGNFVSSIIPTRCAKSSASSICIAIPRKFRMTELVKDSELRGLGETSPRDIEAPFPQHLSVSDSSSTITAPYDQMVSTISVIFLAFILILCLWDTWSTFTDMIAPIHENIVIRCLLNAILLAIGAFIVMRYKGQEKGGRFVILGNLLAGIGLWEFTEGLIECSFGDQTFLKLIFYGCCLIMTFLLIMYLEQTNRLNVLDSPFMSPI